MLIVGSGPLLSRLKEKAENENLANIIFTGKVHFETVPLYIQMANVRVILHIKSVKTDVDAPTKLFEYLASGKPLVSYDLQVITDIADGCVVFAKSNDPEDLFQAIPEVIETSRVSEELREKCKEKILNKFSWQESAKGAYEAYREL